MTQLPKIGDIITYVLLPEDRPIDPDKEYTGKVIAVCELGDCVKVTMLDDEFIGMREIVKSEQIRKIKWAETEQIEN